MATVMKKENTTVTGKTSRIMRLASVPPNSSVPSCASVNNRMLKPLKLFRR